VERASRIPADTKVVVRADRVDVLVRQLPSTAVFALTAVGAGFGFFAAGSAVWLGIGVLCVAGVVGELLAIRSEIGLGPAFAADADHVWVRVGGFLRPLAVRLDWPEVTGIGLRTWEGERRNASARFLTVQVTDDTRAELAALLGRRLRGLTSTLGAPLAISDQRKATTLDEAFHGLRGLAPDVVQFRSG
jgi:hypothetical protein